MAADQSGSGQPKCLADASKAGLLAYTTVLVTGFSQQQREELTQLLLGMGASLHTGVAEHDPPQLVVAGHVRSAKYKAVLMACKPLAIPPVFVTAVWVHACKQQGSLVGYDSYRLGAFAGLTVCLTGFSNDEKINLTALVNQGGGAASAQLDKTCTHLVARSASGEKYMAAVKWGDISVVTAKWIQDSASQGLCLLESAYVLVQPASKSRTVTAGIECQPPGQPAALPQPSCALSGGCPSGSLGGAPLCEPARLPPVSNQALALKLPPLVAQPIAPPPAWHGGEVGGDELFLLGLRLHLTCCTPQEQRELLRVLRAGGAARDDDLQPTVTHIVVGSDPTVREYQDIREHLAKHRDKVQVVTAAWLRQCGAQQACVPVDSRFILTSAQLVLSSAAKEPITTWCQDAAKLPAAQQGTHKPSFSNGIGERSNLGRASSFASHNTTDKLGTSSGTDSRPADPSKPFEGMWFTLAALKDEQLVDRHDAALQREAAEAEDCIRRGGGRLFARNTVKLMTDSTRTNGRAYAVCPTALTLQQQHHLRSHCPDFKAVPEAQQVTTKWLSESWATGQALDHRARDKIAFRPLHFRLPLAGMDRVKACASVYEPEVKDAIKYLVKLLGGTWSSSMGSSNTHLFVPFAAGLKYDAAPARGVIAVTADWLINTATTGTIQREDDYAPPPPAAEQLQALADAGATQMPVTTQATATQGAAVSLRAQLADAMRGSRSGKLAELDPNTSWAQPGSGSQPGSGGSLNASKGQLGSRQGGPGTGQTLLSRVMRGDQPAPAATAAASMPAVRSAAGTSGRSLFDAILDGESKAGGEAGAGLPRQESLLDSIIHQDSVDASDAIVRNHFAVGQRPAAVQAAPGFKGTGQLASQAAVVGRALRAQRHQELFGDAGAAGKEADAVAGCAAPKQVAAAAKGQGEQVLVDLQAMARLEGLLESMPSAPAAVAGGSQAEFPAPAMRAPMGSSRVAGAASGQASPTSSGNTSDTDARRRRQPAQAAASLQAGSTGAPADQQAVANRKRSRKQAAVQPEGGPSTGKRRANRQAAAGADCMMSQMECSQQVGYDQGHRRSTIELPAPPPRTRAAGTLLKGSGGAGPGGGAGRAEEERAKQRLSRAASRAQRQPGKPDDLKDMGLVL